MSDNPIIIADLKRAIERRDTRIKGLSKVVLNGKYLRNKQRDRIAELQAVVDDYRSVGERVLAEDGSWLMLHAGTLDWLLHEFKRLADGKSKNDELIEYAAKHATKEQINDS